MVNIEESIRLRCIVVILLLVDVSDYPSPDKEGGMTHTGFVRLTSMTNVKGGLHHTTFNTISDMIKQKLVYGTAWYDTLAESGSIIRRLHMDIRTVWRSSSTNCQLRRLLETRGCHSPFGVGFVIEPSGQNTALNVKLLERSWMERRKNCGRNYMRTSAMWWFNNVWPLCRKCHERRIEILTAHREAGPMQ